MPSQNLTRSRAPTLLLFSVLVGCPGNDRRDPVDERARDSAIDNVAASTDADVSLGRDGSTDASASDAGTNQGETDSSTPLTSAGDAGLPRTDFDAFLARVAKLKSCNILDDGAYPFFLPFHERCESLCMIAASCEQLKLEACDEDLSESLELCFDGCVEDVVTCGDGQKVASELACDRKSDCKNGEDEAHCETFTCKVDGRKIGAYYRCDGSADCSDLSDEAGCALVCGKPYAESEP